MRVVLVEIVGSANISSEIYAANKILRQVVVNFYFKRPVGGTVEYVDCIPCGEGSDPLP